MLSTILVAALIAANPFRPQAQTLLIHVAHHPDDLSAARLADAVRKACAVPSMECRIADRSSATTFLHVTVQSLWRRSLGTGEVWSSERPDDPAARQVFAGLVGITSQVMLPGSVSARDASLERLGERLLATVKDRLADRTGVLVINPRDAR